MGPDDVLSPPVRPAKVIVRIDWEALVRGWPIDEEVCDMTGVGPVPVTAVREMIASGDVFLAAIVTKGKDVSTWPIWAGSPVPPSAPLLSG